MASTETSQDSKAEFSYGKLFASMASDPSVLLLGQDVLKQYAGEDFFLSFSKDRFGLEFAEDYDDLISNCDGSTDLMSIWHAISSRIAVPENLQIITDLPWNCVITSSFHEVVDRSLAADWRSITPVLDDATFPADPRSRVKLNLYKLFGCVSRDLSNEQPPATEEQQLQRNAVATAMLRQLPSLVTPKGMLFVDCVSGNEWLGIKELCEAISSLGTDQAHLFGVTSDIRRVREVKLLQRLDKIKLHEVSLGEALGKLSDDEYKSLSSASRSWIEGVELTFPSGKKHVFKPADWRRLTKGATLLTDEDANSKYLFASADDKYRRFREFLYGSQGVPNWKAYASGLAFRRQEFDTLKSTVVGSLKQRRLKEEPVIVAGQSGAGKSVALADLAVEVRKLGWPVMYFGRTTTDVDSGLVDTICAELDKVEDTAMLLVWDASRTIEEYASLSSFLASRGRKVLVVGSSYQSGTDATCIELPSIMDGKDAKRLFAHLEEFDKTLVEDVQPEEFERRNFWAWLWRLLPETRGQLRLGLLTEVESFETSLEKSLESGVQESVSAAGTLGSLLAEAGIAGTQTDETLAMDVRDARGEAASHVERLRGLILVPSSFGQDVPVDLILRCLGREGFEILRTALQSTPIFSWIEDESGNHFLGGRQPLEAQTIVNASFSRPEIMGFIKTLLKNVRARGNWRDFNFEVSFALRLLRAVGPDSQLKRPTSEELVELADVIAEMAESSGDNTNPWLSFNEGYFRREALMRKVRSDLDWDDQVEVAKQIPGLIEDYQKAYSAMTRAEESYSSAPNRRENRNLSRIHTEFAGLCDLAQSIEEKISNAMPNTSIQKKVHDVMKSGFDDAVEHCKRAAVYDSENYYTQDVMFRTTHRRFDRISAAKAGSDSDKESSSSEKVELVSNMCDILDHESWRGSNEKYNKRKYELGLVLNDESIQEEALESLAKQGSTAGEYMLAWKKIYDQRREWRSDEEIESALIRIEGLGDRLDLRLTRLYTQAWWRRFGKTDIYDAERATAALSREQWEHYVKWLRRRLAFHEEESLTARFFYAWGLFQSGQYREAEEQFRILDRSTMAGRYRVVKMCLWSDDAGKPIECQGTVRRVSQDGDKGWVYVPLLRREVLFRPNDYNEQDVKPNKPLLDFHIAFNFRGPIADPGRFLRTEPTPRA